MDRVNEKKKTHQHYETEQGKAKYVNKLFNTFIKKTLVYGKLCW